MPKEAKKIRNGLRAAMGWTRGPAYSFLKSLSKALRASSALRDAGGPELVEDGGGGAVPAVPSRATVTRGLKEMQSLALSFTGMRTGIGFRH